MKALAIVDALFALLFAWLLFCAITDARYALAALFALLLLGWSAMTVKHWTEDL